MSESDSKTDRPKRLADMANDLSVFLGDRQRIYAERAQDFGHAKENFSSLAKSFSNSPDSKSFDRAERSLEKFGQLLRTKELSLDKMMFDVSSAAYATTTASTSNATVSYFETKGIWNDQLNFPAPPPQWSKDRIGLYATRLEKLDPELGRLARSIWQHFYGGTENPERASLLSMRQLYDHLFSLLAPDDDVRRSNHFKKKESKLPNQIHRRDRLFFAAESRVRDRQLAQLLVANVDQVIDTYERLNLLHGRQTISAEAARRALVSMQAVIEQWVDALEL